MREARATIADVAAAAGVSIMSVSRAMRGVEGLSPQKRAEIIAIARRLGYRPNRNAMSLALAHSNLIGISLPTLFNDVFAEILDGMRRTFDSAGYDTVIDTSDYSLAREEAWVERMIDWKAAAVILSGVHHAPAVGSKLRAARIPTLEIWDRTDDPIDVCVGFDHHEAGRQIGGHLVAMGYRRPAFVGVTEGRDRRAEQRLAGLMAVTGAAGLAPVRIARVDQVSSFEGGMRGTMTLMAAQDRPDVICYLNDHMAFGGLATCEKLGFSVPETVGIVGFNGLGINAVLPRPLTTVITERRQMGMISARVLLARIKGARVERHTVLPTRLAQGATTAPVLRPQQS